MTNAQIRNMIVALFEELAKRDGVPVEEVVDAFVASYEGEKLASH